MVKKKNFTAKITDLLPEGLDESLITSIAKLIDEKINEEVSKEVATLTRKTVAFVRSQIEAIKEQAIKELELENETFRNASLFEHVRSLMAVELNDADEVNAVNALASIGESQEQQISVLVGEVDRLLQENKQLKKSVKVVTDKNRVLEESVARLEENADAIVEGSQAPAMSDSAVVVSEKSFQKKKKPAQNDVQKIQHETGNQFITQSVLESLKVLK